MIFYPSVRSVAYLNAFRELGVYPDETIIMPGAVPKLDHVIRESEEYGYRRLFFDVGFDYMEFLGSSGSKILKVPSADINAPSVHEALKKVQNSYVLFSGGGILKRQTIDTGKLFIHVHPGIVPAYRGSTCFYYSILSENFLGSTAFIMSERIDAGDVIAESMFKINYRVQAGQKLFFDYILDPFIRYMTFKKVLTMYLKSERFTPTPQVTTEKPAYYIMHSLLRHLTVNRINKLYDETANAGIFEYF